MRKVWIHKSVVLGSTTSFTAFGIDPEPYGHKGYEPYLAVRESHPDAMLDAIAAEHERQRAEAERSGALSYQHSQWPHSAPEPVTSENRHQTSPGRVTMTFTTLSKD